MAKRETYHHGNLRQSILDESRRQLEARGVASFSLSAVATALGVSSGAPYHHFGGREELLRCLAEEVYGELLACVRDAARPSSPGAGDANGQVRTSIVAACHALLTYCLEHAVLFKLATQDYRPARGSAAFELGRAMSEDGAPLTAAGVVDAERAEEFGAAVYVMLRGVTAIAEEAPRLVPHATEPHVLLDQVLDALFVAYAPEARTGTSAEKPS